jgi:hypothetical protein
MPSSIRPPDVWSAVTTDLASTDGCRNDVGETIVPSRIREVTGPSAASVPHASSELRSVRDCTDW